jgi:chromosome segregation ATPase
MTDVSQHCPECERLAAEAEALRASLNERRREAEHAAQRERALRAERDETQLAYETALSTIDQQKAQSDEWRADAVEAEARMYVAIEDRDAHLKAMEHALRGLEAHPHLVAIFQRRYREAMNRGK